MKKLHLLKSMLLLCALIVGSGSSWATDVVYKTQQFTTGASSTFSAGVSGYSDVSFDNTYDGFTCNYSNFNNNNKGWTYVKCGGKNGAYTGVITTDAAIDKAINKVTLTIDAITASNVTSITLYSSDSKSSGWTSVGTFAKSTGAKDIAISSPAANKYYKIEAVCTKHSSTNGLLTISKIQFYIENVAITSISLPSTESVGVGGTVTLTPTVSPVNYTETIDWESDDTDVATVSSAGVVTGVSAGTAHIKAKAHDNPSTIYGECTVSVTAPVAVTGVSLDKTSLLLSVGSTATLAPTIAPADATNKAVTWESDDTGVATVDDDGKVTAVDEGTCTITVTTDDGDFTATCDVTVTTDVNLTNPISITTWPSLSYGAAASYVAGGVCFTATQCMNSSGLQFRKSDGELVSPLIKSTYGYTVIVTTNASGSGTLTLQIGSETPVNISSGSSTTYSATTSSTSVAFTLTNSSSNACNIASLTITPNLPGPSNPTTSGDETYLTTTDNMAGWRAFYDASNSYSVDGNTKVYVADADAVGTTITLKSIAGIPANVPVILHTSSSADSHKMTLTKETVSPYAYTGENNLIWTTSAVTEKYRLGYGAAGVGFYPYTGTPASGAVILNVSSAGAHALTIDFEEGNVTGIAEVSAKKQFNGEFFNLAGQRVANPAKGLYIMNGKKVVIK